MSGGEGASEDDGEDIWTDMVAGIAGSGVDAGYCWLEWRGGLGLVALLSVCAVAIDDDLWLIVVVVRFCRIASVGHAMLFLAWASRWYIRRHFPFLRGDTCGVTGPVRGCLCARTCEEVSSAT